jgi:hypothetical protein
LTGMASWQCGQVTCEPDVSESRVKSVAQPVQWMFIDALP